MSNESMAELSRFDFRDTAGACNNRLIIRCQGSAGSLRHANSITFNHGQLNSNDSEASTTFFISVTREQALGRC